MCLVGLRLVSLHSCMRQFLKVKSLFMCICNQISLSLSICMYTYICIFHLLRSCFSPARSLRNQLLSHLDYVTVLCLKLPGGWHGLALAGKWSSWVPAASASGFFSNWIKLIWPPSAEVKPQFLNEENDFGLTSPGGGHYVSVHYSLKEKESKGHLWIP